MGWPALCGAFGRDVLVRPGPIGIAFLLLIAVSSLGVLIAVRLRFILVAIIALVGAYMVPILLSTGEPSYVIYPAYMLLLLATGLFISAFLRGNFVHIRTLVWARSFMLGGFWVLADGYQSPINGLSGVLFVTIAWILVHAELLLAALAMLAIFPGTHARAARWHGRHRSACAVACSGVRSR